KIPQLILDVIKQCWDADPLKRPKAEELSSLFSNLGDSARNKSDPVFNKQFKEADEANKKLSSSTATSSSTGVSYTTHTQAIYTSRLLNFKSLPEPKNADDETEYS